MKPRPLTELEIEAVPTSGRIPVDKPGGLSMAEQVAWSRKMMKNARTACMVHGGEGDGCVYVAGQDYGSLKGTDPVFIKIPVQMLAQTLAHLAVIGGTVKGAQPGEIPADLKRVQ